VVPGGVESLPVVLGVEGAEDFLEGLPLESRDVCSFIKVLGIVAAVASEFEP